MECPKCEARTLEAQIVDFIEVDACAHCGGIWFDKSELGELLRRDDRRVAPLLGGDDPDDHDQQHGGRCPRDGSGLLRVKSSRAREVTLDTCVTCQGIWLDGGEFARIKQAEPGVRLADLI